jgi:DNA-binding transcriptional regulator YdaS (Cro superfamily)
MQTPIQKAIKIAGSQSALARKIGVPPQYVQYWAKKNRVPAERVIAIEKATDGEVTRAELRPDLFGTDPELEPARKCNYA